jgi:hypothetical protein
MGVALYVAGTTVAVSRDQLMFLLTMAAILAACIVSYYIGRIVQYDYDIQQRYVIVPRKVKGWPGGPMGREPSAGWGLDGLLTNSSPGFPCDDSQEVLPIPTRTDRDEAGAEMGPVYLGQSDRVEPATIVAGYGTYGDRGFPRTAVDSVRYRRKV